MTLRDIFSSIGSFFGKLWNGLLDLDIFETLGLILFFIYAPILIYTLAKKGKTSSILFACVVFFIYFYFLVIFFGSNYFGSN